LLTLVRQRLDYVRASFTAGNDPYDCGALQQLSKRYIHLPGIHLALWFILVFALIASKNDFGFLTVNFLEITVWPKRTLFLD